VSCLRDIDAPSLSVMKLCSVQQHAQQLSWLVLELDYGSMKEAHLSHEINA
jgi:hypothetical protein